MHLPYLILDVFTETPLAGNPLAVFPQADGLDKITMQRIAGEMNLSESVFVTNADPAARRYPVTIMTPHLELPFAGHPLVGTGLALSLLEAREHGTAAGSLTLVPPVGAADMTVALSGARSGTARFTAPRVPEEVPSTLTRPDAAKLLGLSPEAIAHEDQRAWSAGAPFQMIALAQPEALDACALDLTFWKERVAGAPASDIYPYYWTAEDPGLIRARMFGPHVGITEDPATGGAAVALTGELAARGRLPDGLQTTRIHQGETMGRPSTLHLSWTQEQGRPTRVSLGGPAVLLGEGTLTLA